MSHENNNSMLTFPSNANFLSMEKEGRSSRLMGPDHLVEPPFTQSPATFVGSVLYSFITELRDDDAMVVGPIRSFAYEAFNRASAFKEIEEFQHESDGSDLSFFTKTPEEYFGLNPKPKSTDGAVGEEAGSLGAKEGTKERVPSLRETIYSLAMNMMQYVLGIFLPKHDD